MHVSVSVLILLLVYGTILGLGAVGIRRFFLRNRAGPNQAVELKILDEIDQLDVQIQIFNERLKRVEDQALLGSGRRGGAHELERGE